MSEVNVSVAPLSRYELEVSKFGMVTSEQILRKNDVTAVSSFSIKSTVIYYYCYLLNRYILAVAISSNSRST